VQDSPPGRKRCRKVPDVMQDAWMMGTQIQNSCSDHDSGSMPSARARLCMVSKSKGATERGPAPRRSLGYVVLTQTTGSSAPAPKRAVMSSYISDHP